jgi:DNA polymerase III alpha subunit
MSIKYSESEIIKGILKFGPDIIPKILADTDSIKLYTDQIKKEKLRYPIPSESIDISSWMIPQEYKNIDIENFLVDRCPKENLDRLTEELRLYKKHEMIPVLQTTKYIIDTLRKNDIVWGVGRGSSVASYALFLLGVHKIDSVKYNLPIEEFFKGEQNG